MIKSRMLQVAHRSSFLMPLFLSTSLSNSGGMLTPVFWALSLILYSTRPSPIPCSFLPTSTSEYLAFWNPNSKGVAFLTLLLLAVAEIYNLSAHPPCFLWKSNKIGLQLNKKGGGMIFPLNQRKTGQRDRETHFKIMKINLVWGLSMRLF